MKLLGIICVVQTISYVVTTQELFRWFREQAALFWANAYFVYWINCPYCFSFYVAAIWFFAGEINLIQYFMVIVGSATITRYLQGDTH